jgi:thiazole synthase ThiGH ThiG subunit
MGRLSRRQFVSSAPAVLGGAAVLSACAREAKPGRYEDAAERIRRAGPLDNTLGAALTQELIRYSTLATSSHNTQCWKFALETQAITILPDTLRRCPAVLAVAQRRGGLGMRRGFG